MSLNRDLEQLLNGEGISCEGDVCGPIGAGFGGPGERQAAAPKAEDGGSAAARTILPGATIGILGGGQLGRMLAHAGGRMGYKFVTLDPTPDAPCGQTADQIVAGYSDRKAARELARRSDVITYEFENVDADVAAMLASESYVPQGSDLLHTTQHRLREKRAIEAAGARVAPYAEIASLEGLREAAARLGLPAVLKTATGGYDGKGQWVLREEADLAPAWAEAEQAGTALVLEKFIVFDREISVIAARRPSGEIRTFPPAENVHVRNILHLSIVPARVDDTIRAEAERLAVSIAETLGAVGLIAVEMFVATDGTLYVNELAPRPHNSGHYTMEASKTSQFEQHIRAICDLPLGDPGLLTPVVMANVLGEHVLPLLDWMRTADPEAARLGVEPKVHLYGKAEAKHKRKMGHVNVLAPNVEAALAWIAQSNIWRV
ncbi:5-(carboxyamino)imidazole ribonucleotide synthase [Cohnella nanjingensis]|uniref:N5-carboxyaminoimidazole ribonucleotide synthase n=1 Tax=Cohnella nanjingensis TaxID=1387779 RepID=A0A7X0RMG7_9BACL|nr:5-(carboxyamino)imidazole ribonucleotide synthase [Cohnella nanjingensis]MBB6670175.1 5-(carboxyamino)imidazole ribonucleotide synthase [Cohnella nanjingensis]